MTSLLFGTAGIPITTPEPNTVNGIHYVKELGLGCMELEFVRSVNISEEKAPLVKEAAEKSNVILTCHGQYYINLNSQELEKIGASKQRIYNAAKIASLCGARSMTFHAAFYMKQDHESVFQRVKSGVQDVLEKLNDDGHPIFIRPETTGKPTQWGNLKEVIRLSQEVENVLPCIDFSHLHARSGGKNNTLEEFRGMLTQVENGLGKEALNNMHIHISGIEYGEKGERRHVILAQCDFHYIDLLRAFKEFNIKGVVISESPNIESDALLMKKKYLKL